MICICRMRLQRHGEFGFVGTRYFGEKQETDPAVERIKTIVAQFLRKTRFQGRLRSRGEIDPRVMVG